MSALTIIVPALSRDTANTAMSSLMGAAAGGQTFTNGLVASAGLDTADATHYWCHFANAEAETVTGILAALAGVVGLITAQDQHPETTLAANSLKRQLIAPIPVAAQI